MLLNCTINVFDNEELLILRKELVIDHNILPIHDTIFCIASNLLQRDFSVVTFECKKLLTSKVKSSKPKFVYRKLSDPNLWAEFI